MMCVLVTEQVGVIFINIPLWVLGIRKAPKLQLNDWVRLAPIGLFAAGAHGGSVLALGGGSVTFAQIVKACEPVGTRFSCSSISHIVFHPIPWPLCTHRSGILQLDM